MANKLSKEKAEAIAAAYCTNGYRKVDALLEMGYSTHYANHVGLKLFDNATVRTAIDELQAHSKAGTVFTLLQAEKEYEEARILSMGINQPSAAVSAITGKARLYGMDKDNQIAPDMPASITEAQAELYRGMARAATRLRLSKDTVDKETA